MEDAGIHDIRSCSRVPGIYIVPWYSVTSGKTEIGFSSLSLCKRGDGFYRSIDSFRSSLLTKIYVVSLKELSHYLNYTNLSFRKLRKLFRVRDLFRNLEVQYKTKLLK